MTKKYKVYDPVSLQYHLVNMEEIRCWLNIDMLQQYMKQPQYKQQFYNLNPEYKQDFLSFLDTHDKPLRFRINPVTENPYLDIYFDLHIYHDPSIEKFHDTVQSHVRDELFFEKKVKTQVCPAQLHIQQSLFPLETIFAISDDFITSTPMDKDTSFIVENSEDEIENALMIDLNGKVSILSINHHIYKEYKWIFELTVHLQVKSEWKNVVWSNTPRIKPLYDFLKNENFSLKQENEEHTIWERNGDVIEYYQFPIRGQEPFVLIKSFQEDVDYEGRNVFGEYLLEKMENQGLLEEILFYRGNAVLAKALDKVKIKNKMPADQLLSESMTIFDQCNNDLYPVAQIEIMFCSWVKSRIAHSVQDDEIKFKNYANIARIMYELRTYEHLKWFLMKIYNEDKKKFAMKIIKDLFPLKTADKHFFISKQSYQQLLQLWDHSQYEENCPPNVHESEWHYHIAKQAEEIGLKDVAYKRFRAFCKASERNIEHLKWAIEGTDDLLEFAMKVGANKEYLAFSKHMSDFYGRKRKNQRIGDLDAIGRKIYRWTVFTWGMAEMRWSFHAAYLSSKQEKPDRELIRKLYNQGYQAFTESILSYDPTETYLDEQLKFIAQSFLTAYHMAFALRDEQMIEYIYSLSKELWLNYPNKEIYDIIHVMCNKKEREEMTDVLLDTWMSSITEEEGEFQMTIERGIYLAELYISVEEWSEAAKTIALVLDQFAIDYSNLNKVYEMYRTVEKFSPEDCAICEEQVVRWLHVYQTQTEDARQYIPTLVQRINRIKQI